MKQFIIVYWIFLSFCYSLKKNQLICHVCIDSKFMSCKNYLNLFLSIKNLDLFLSIKDVPNLLTTLFQNLGLAYFSYLASIECVPTPWYGTGLLTIISWVSLPPTYIIVAISWVFSYSHIGYICYCECSAKPVCFIFQSNAHFQDCLQTFRTKKVW